MAQEQTEYIGGIDAGGTTFKCAVQDSHGNIVHRQRVPTTTPQETIEACVAFFKAWEAENNLRISALGVASFGPLDIDPDSKSYGAIMQTPKKGWSMTPLLTRFEDALSVPVYIQTDVNGALAAEMNSGAAQRCDSAAYITVGTGIGAGIYANGGFLGRPSHPEFGHFYVQRHDRDIGFEGLCSFHGECLEGLASAAAFEARYGDPRQLPESHIGWCIEAFYLAQACINLVTSTRLERIILGGGLLQAPHLLSIVKAQFLLLNADYLPFTPEIVNSLIVRPKFGDDAGLMGAFTLCR